MVERPLLIAQLDAMNDARGGDFHYRSLLPGRALGRFAYTVNVTQAHRKLGYVLEHADVLIINGVCSADLLPVMHARRRARRATVFEISDDVAAMDPHNPLFAFFSQPENQLLFRRLAHTADAIQLSTPELERLYGWLNPRRCVFENQLGAVPPLRENDRAPGEVVLGWGGSAGHLQDLAELVTPLSEFLRGQPHVVLHLMCSESIWALFEDVPETRKRRSLPGSIEDYYAFVSQLDIGIAPNRDVGFNRCRSDVKFLEYAAHGAVPVVQRLTPYLHSVRDGEAGFLFGGRTELFELLARLANDPAERRRVRRNAHRYVCEQRLITPHVSERLQFYEETLAALARGAPDGEAERAFEEICSWQGVERNGRHALLSATEFELLLFAGLVQLQHETTQLEGAAVLREAVRLEPSHALPELFLGVQLGSATDLTNALAKNPRSVQALLALGWLELQAGSLRAGLGRFLAAAELAPGYELPYLRAAAALQALGATKDAREFEALAGAMAAAVMPPAVAP
jgi:glycosyltransferase involved in cell wall biosynthesis